MVKLRLWVQLLAAVLFLLQVPLHLKHEMLSAAVQSAAQNGLAEQPETVLQAHQHMHHNMHHAGAQPAKNAASHPDHSSKHQNHDCSCCMPMVSEAPASQKLPDSQKLQTQAMECPLVFGKNVALRPKARAPPSGSI
ncbi:hypothetical protein [Deinococcus roseus]|nr:hypothetical protein [Deinococcus roseus]